MSLKIILLLSRMALYIPDSSWKKYTISNTIDNLFQQ